MSLGDLFGKSEKWRDKILDALILMSLWGGQPETDTYMSRFCVVAYGLGRGSRHSKVKPRICTPFLIINKDLLRYTGLLYLVLSPCLGLKIDQRKFLSGEKERLTSVFPQKC